MFHTETPFKSEEIYHFVTSTCGALPKVGETLRTLVEYSSFEL